MAKTKQVDQAELERSPDYWWLRLRYAFRDGDLPAAGDAQKRLTLLGIDVRIPDLEPLATKEGCP